MTTIATMFATFVAFVSGVIFLTEAVNKTFKVENGNAKLIISWVTSIVMAAIGFVMQLGFFADCGAITEWQGWVKTALIGLGCAVCANKMYNRDEIWRLLELLFSFFEKGGKAKRSAMKK